MKRGKALAAAAVMLVLAGGPVGCGTSLDSLGESSGGSSGDDTGGTSAAEALKDLDKLPVKGRAPRTGFDRDEFGPAWADVDHNGCDTRNDILKRDLKDETFKKGTHDCIVLTGTLEDPYGGKTIEFERGQDTSMKVQIDHLVALSDAWQKGAQQLGAAERRELANDPLNLLAVDGPLNSQKSDADAATWLPPRRAYRCPYVARQIKVKLKYELWVTSAEKSAMERVLKAC
ncbi:HNH endonuclease family protein [Planobispora takensis]|uniref:HNH endonuclease family protein n=1 Tax=Planobispora takensis TaxID=1367882 RepID=UPI001EF21B64|nr:HNH endonuclease family protein [Planobispora takensis]